MKNFLKIFIFALSLVALNSCSSDSSSDSTTTTSDTTTNSGAAITAMFSGSSSASESDQVLLKIQALMIRLAHAQEEGGQSDNCEEEAGESEDVTVGQDGEAGDYGPASDSVTIAESDFCANGGAYSTYEISADNPVQFDCDDTTVVMIGGSGVWDYNVDVGTTEVAGSFTVADDTDGTNSAEVDCHGSFTSDGSTSTFDMNCTDSDGAAITLDEDVTCTQS